MRPIRVLTWHIHGSYLYYLSQTPCEFYLPVKKDGSEGYGGRAGFFPWPDNVIEVPAENIERLQLDCILFQSRKNYEEDQYRILNTAQQALPKIYLEHDPPREHPTDTRHWVNDSEVLLVHVTSFNNLMWDSHRTPTRVIDHGVIVPDNVSYRGDLNAGIVVVNGLRKRGRRLGYDIFEYVRSRVPLDLAGMQSEELGGLGDISLTKLPAVQTRYRFFFNPIRYTSLGLAVCEAMMLGMPIIGLATTEMVTAIENDVSGYVDTNPEKLIGRMETLLKDRRLAARLGEGAQRTARRRFGIGRFKQDWLDTFSEVTGIGANRHRTRIAKENSVQLSQL